MNQVMLGAHRHRTATSSGRSAAAGGAVTSRGVTPPDLDPDTRARLDRHGFDAERFADHQRRLRDGRAQPGSASYTGAVEPPPGDLLVRLPEPGGEDFEALAKRGREAIAAGEVGAVFLAGGMATRFGGVVKAGVEVLDGRSFLDLKLDDAEAAAIDADGRVPVFLMTSFATDERVRSLVADRETPRLPIDVFEQFVSIRLTPDGDVFRDDAGDVSLHAPGHGDLPAALRASGVLDRFRAGGGRLLFMSNIDNLGATLDPVVIGAHLESGAAMTAEVVDKEPGDAGGAPALVDGRPVLVEGFRFPADFDQARIPVFSTNTFTLDAEAIDRDFDFTWCPVRKEVDGRPTVQFERIVNELTTWLPSQFLVVPRHGERGRFQPAKDPAELTRRLPEIRRILAARGL